MNSNYLIMKLHFDSYQEYQIDAIRAVTDIFEEQPLSGWNFEFSLTETEMVLYMRIPANLDHPFR